MKQLRQNNNMANRTMLQYEREIIWVHWGWGAGVKQIHIWNLFYVNK